MFEKLIKGTKAVKVAVTVVFVCGVSTRGYVVMLNAVGQEAGGAQKVKF